MTRRPQHQARNRKTLLITGFEPFGGHAENPSQWLAETLPQSLLGKFDPDAPTHWSVRARVLPVDWKSAPAQLEADLRIKPDVVIAFGLADGPAVRLERLAANVAGDDLADNAGARWQSAHLIPGAPLAYESGLPVPALLAALQGAQIPVQTSVHAGGFLCNCVFFHVMRWAARSTSPLTAGFVHVPTFATLAQAEQLRAAELIVLTTLAAVDQPQSDPTQHQVQQQQ